MEFRKRAALVWGRAWWGLLFLMVLLLAAGPARAGEAKYLVEDNAYGQSLLEQVRSVVASSLGLYVQEKIVVVMTSAEDLRRISQMEVAQMRSYGAYSGGRTTLYVLSGINRDQFAQEASQMLARSWLGTVAPRAQSLELQNGFVALVSYHTLQKLGAYRAADEMLRTDDPHIYGMRKLISLEEQLGWDGLLKLMSTATEMPR